MRRKMTEENVKQYVRLQKYLIELHQKGNVCVFADLSGHVDWVDVHITPSQEDYDVRLYQRTIYTDCLTKKVVDDTIKVINNVLDNLEAKKKEIAAEKEQQERETYEKLKAKYGAKK